MRTNLPQISFLRLSLYVSELILQKEAWMQETRVLFVWHLFFFSVLGLAVGSWAARLFLMTELARSATLTLAFRLCSVVGEVAVIAILAVLACRFYQSLLLTNRDLTFSSVAFFWIVWLMSYTLLYQYVFELKPSLFTSAHLLWVPQPTYVENLPMSIRAHTLVVFMTYSACVATTVGFPYLNSNSVIVSLLNLTEVVGSLLFIVLVVATYAAKKATSKRK
jgi:hypothetical protein